ncbi:MAG: DUF488 family protein [Archangium sp.]
MKLFTIGFTKSSAEQFFKRLIDARVSTVVDVRLNNESQLAGFSKKEDLRYFLRTIASIEYVHEPLLAPTRELLDAYKKTGGSWATYEAGFLQLMQEHRIERAVWPHFRDAACLLCSEAEATWCHRRLVGEYLQRHWPAVMCTHL